MKTLSPAERLIVAADFKPTPGLSQRGGESYTEVEQAVLRLAQDLEGTGVYIKVNSALRALGYHLIKILHDHGLKVFADLKLYDIGETLSTDGAILREVKPELLTTVCMAGISAMRALKAQLPETEVLGVTVLTSLKEADTEEMFSATVEASVMKFALLAEAAELDGVICAPKDISYIRSVVKRAMSFNTPAIRPKWAIVPGDDQNPERIMTPAKAIKAGADRIIVGRSILRAIDPRLAVLETIKEIARAMEEMKGRTQ